MDPWLRKGASPSNAPKRHRPRWRSRRWWIGIKCWFPGWSAFQRRYELFGVCPGSRPIFGPQTSHKAAPRSGEYRLNRGLRLLFGLLYWWNNPESFSLPGSRKQRPQTLRPEAKSPPRTGPSCEYPSGTPPPHRRWSSWKYRDPSTRRSGSWLPRLRPPPRASGILVNNSVIISCLLIKIYLGPFPPPSYR